MSTVLHLTLGRLVSIGDDVSCRTETAESGCATLAAVWRHGRMRFREPGEEPPSLVRDALAIVTCCAGKC